METAQKMVDEAAKEAGYDNTSDYQGSLAFSGSAPDGYAMPITQQKKSVSI